MKKPFFICLVFSCLLLFSCNSREALQFNQKLVNFQKEILFKTESMHDIPRDSVEKWVNFSKYLKDKIAEMKALPAPEGGEDFKEAMVNDISGLAEANELNEKIYLNKDNESMLRFSEQFDSLKLKLEKLDQRVEDEQIKFAKLKHFKL